MAAKPKKDDTQPVKQLIKVKGGIHAGRDVIQGDQTNYITVTQTNNIQTAAEFVAALQQVRAEISALKSQPGLDADDIKTIEVVEGRIIAASDEAQKEQPAAGEIIPKLEKAKATLESLTASLGAAAALGTTIGGLIMMAVKLFGG